RRGGYILMEVIVAMTLLALIMTPLAAMVYKITARNHRTVGNTYRNAVAMHHVNLLESLPYDSLPEGSWTETVTAEPYPHAIDVSVDEYYQKWQLKAKRVQLIIAPTNPLYKRDTINFVRTSANTRTTFIDDGF
ncbi:MAG: type IV pilus modification PilV family protein, partial [Gemmatimonadaceae bacterium]